MSVKIFQDYQGASVKIDGQCYLFVEETTEAINADPSEIGGVFDSCLECTLESSTSSSSDSSESFNNVSSSSSSSSRGFNPLDVSPVGWWDATDSDTITDSGGNVSQWDDKSGNNYDVTQGSGSDQPITGTRNINGLNILDFPQKELSINSRLGLGANPDVMIAVVIVVDSSVTSDDRWCGFSGNVTNSIKVSVGSDGWAWRYNNGNDKYTPVTLSTPTITVMTRPQGGTYGDARCFVNGVEQAESVQTNPTSIPNDTTQLFEIGDGDVGGGNKRFDGAIGELIVVEDETLDTRQKLEGYLAWKWSLEDNLPSDHPYKGAPP